jgi:hypothetical protein
MNDQDKNVEFKEFEGPHGLQLAVLPVGGHDADESFVYEEFPEKLQTTPGRYGSVTKSSSSLQ